MKNLTLLAAIFLLTPALATAEPDYRVKGDSQAMIVCNAVLSNDAASLDKVLTNYHRKNRALAYYLPKHDTVMLKDFTCNDMSLYDFSNKVGATNVSRYIRSYMQGQPRVYVEDVAEQAEPSKDVLYF